MIEQTQRQLIREWYRQAYGYFVKRINGNQEVIKDILDASKQFAKVKTREGNIFWMHSVNGHMVEVGTEDRMAQIQEAAKRVDEAEDAK